MDNAERVGRVELAAAFRLAMRLGFHEGIDNHFSLALTADGGEFLVNPYGRHFGELRARDLLRVNTAGVVLAGDGEVEPTALYIHGRMHAARPELRCILHTHMPYATALASVAGARLEPINQNALRFSGQIDYGGLALDGGEGERLAAMLGDKRILFMANHGVATTGPSVASAFDDLYFLERACQNQVLAMSTGRPLKQLPDDEVTRIQAQFGHYEGHELAEEERYRWMKPLAENLENGVIWYDIPEVGEVVGVTELRWNQAVVGELSAKDALNAAAEDIHAIMERAGYETGMLPKL